MAEDRSLTRRALRRAYDLVQAHPGLKRLAIRLLMRFPQTGTWALRQVNGTEAPAAAAPTGEVDIAARDTYLAHGYGPLLQPPAAEPGSDARQLIVDMTGLVERDAATGIQRVVRNLTHAMAALGLPGWRIEPVYFADGAFRYARRYVTRTWGLPELGLPDEPLRAGPGDIFFTADVPLLPIAAMQPALRALRARGVPLYFVVHDLIPLRNPEFFQGQADPRFVRWLDIVLESADGLLCVSQAVADDVQLWLREQGRSAPPRGVGWFHLGADLATSGRPSAPITGSGHGAPQFANPDLPTLLMVGTVEPRKGHEQVLSAFERLWADGVAVNLHIIGKPGWQVQRLIDRLRQHPEAGQHLCWQGQVDDATLTSAYASASGLLFASYAEGFGLPLIEAASHGVPLLVRDLPVFREIAGPHASYFHAEAPEALARAVQTWLDAYAEGRVPASTGIACQSWAQSAAQVTQQILPVPVPAADAAKPAAPMA